MNTFAQPAPKVEALSGIERAPRVDEAKTEAAQPVEAATASRVCAAEPAACFDPKLHSPLPKEAKQETGISVNALRAGNSTNITAFESEAAVLRGAPPKNFLKRTVPLFFDERDFCSYGEVKRFIIVKGDCCFVFTEMTAMAPLYAISLDEVRPVMENPKKPDKFSVTISPTSVHGTKESMVTVLLKYRHDGSQAYQFTFDTSKDRSAAKRFYDVIENACSKAQPLTGSILHPKVVGKAAAKAQPGH